MRDLLCPRSLAEVAVKLASILAFPSTVSQMLVHGMLEQWGQPGLDKHLQTLRAKYVRKCDLMQRSLTQHVGTTLAKWRPPESGMFFWLDIVGGPWASVLPTAEGAAKIVAASQKARVTLVPGSFFRVGEAPSGGIRLAFVSISDDDIVEGCKRLGQLLRTAPA
jgi:DNA-binding transcriptional MocR family regulator